MIKLPEFKKILLPLNVIFGFLIAKIALADELRDRLGRVVGEAKLPATEASPQRIILNILFYVFGFLGLFFLISIIYAGFAWMTSGGSEDKIGEAKKRLKNSVVGIIIVLAAFIIVWYVNDVLIKASVEGYYYGYPPGEKAP